MKNSEVHTINGFVWSLIAPPPSRANPSVSEKCVSRTLKICIVYWHQVKRLLKEDKVDVLADPHLKKNYDRRELETLLQVSHLWHPKVLHVTYNVMWQCRLLGQKWEHNGWLCKVGSHEQPPVLLVHVHVIPVNKWMKLKFELSVPPTWH